MVLQSPSDAVTESRINPPRRKQAHRRNPRACKECRARKRKCDGSQPCRTCNSSQLECVYQSDKSTVTATERIRVLEHNLREATTLLQDLNDRLPSDGKAYVRPILEGLNSWSDESHSPGTQAGHDDQKQKLKLASMLSGCPRLISATPWAPVYYGPFSEVSFVLRTLELFDRGAYSPGETIGLLTDMFNSPMPDLPRFETKSHTDPAHSSVLSDRSTAIDLVTNLFDSSHPFTSFLLKEPTRDIVEAVHNPTNVVHLHNHTPSFAFYHAILALGQIMDCRSQRHASCTENMQKAWHHFGIAESLLGSYSCDHPLSTQACLCQMIFLISTSHFSSAHALLGMVYSNVVRLGYHKGLPEAYQETYHQHVQRITTFSTLVKIDLYISLILDLPRLVSDGHVHDCVNSLGRLTEHSPDLILVASAKQLELLYFTCTARQTIFCDRDVGGNGDTIDPAKLANVEQDLRRWTDDLSALMLQMGDNVEFAMLKYELEMALYFSQLILFRPFLHYLSVMAEGKAIPLSQSRHALACVKIASTTIVRAEALQRQLPNIGATWSTTYTLFLAVMCLVFLISAHDGTSQPGEAWRRAVTGLRSLYRDRCTKDCASTGLRVLEKVVQQLNHTVDFDFRRIEKEAREEPRTSVPISQLSVADGREDDTSQTDDGRRTRVQNTRDDIDHYADADTMLARAEELPLGFGFVELLNADLDEAMEEFA